MQNVIKMVLKLKIDSFLSKITKIAQQLGAKALVYDTLELHQFVQHGT